MGRKTQSFRDGTRDIPNGKHHIRQISHFPRRKGSKLSFHSQRQSKCSPHRHKHRMSKHLIRTKSSLPQLLLIVGCDLYEYMATRTLEKIVQFFEGGQSAILGETVVDEEPEADDELHELGNWDDLKKKMESGNMERLLEVGIGAGEDDSEWFRVR